MIGLTEYSLQFVPEIFLFEIAFPGCFYDNLANLPKMHVLKKCLFIVSSIF